MRQQVPLAIALIMQVAHDSADQVNSQPAAAFLQGRVNIGVRRGGGVERTPAIAELHFHAVRSHSANVHERRPARPRIRRAAPS